MAGSAAAERFREIGTGISFIAFPLMLLAGFALHPHLLSFARVTDAQAWAGEFRGSLIFHVGHLLVLLTVPFIIVVGIRCMKLVGRDAEWLGLIGGVLGIFGAFVLAVDKGALTLVLTAFDTLSDAEFAGIYPALQSLLDRQGMLWFVSLLPLLPVGFSILAYGMVRARVIGECQGAAIIIGLLLLINPDIEIISTLGALLLCLGYIPVGAAILRGAKST